MPTRRNVLLVAAAAAAGFELAACNDIERAPQAPQSPRTPPTLDLSMLREVVLRPNDVSAAAKTVVRIWANDRKRTPRTVTTGVRVERPNLVLGTERLRRQPEDGEIILHDLQVQVATDVGGVVVRQATKAAVLDRLDTVLFQINDPPNENIASTVVDPSILTPGTVLHTAGYKPAGPRGAAVSIGAEAPQTGFRMAFLSSFAGQSHAFMSSDFNASEGELRAERPFPGDAVFTEQGLLLGSVINAREITVGQVMENKDGYGVFDRVVDSGNDVASDTKGWVVTCRTVDKFLVNDLIKNLADLPGA